MFNVYNDAFPYSVVTEKLVAGFPSWTKVRKDPNSIGQQFLNVFGLILEEVERYLSEALNNQYAGTANLGDVDWLYKIYLTDPFDVTKPVIGKIGGEEYHLTEIGSLHDFYASANQHVFIVDYDTNIIYLKYVADKKTYDEVVVNGVPVLFGDDALTSHHILNVFDEFALLLGLQRRELETNAELKERILDVFRFPGNATKVGLIRGIGRDLGLIHKAIWPANEVPFELTDDELIPETIIVNGEPLRPEQLEGESGSWRIYPRISVFPGAKGDSKFESVHIDDNGRLVLDAGSVSGRYISPTFSPRDLDSWSSLAAEAEGDITFDLVTHDFESMPDPKDGIIAQSLSGSLYELKTAATPLTISRPIRVIVHLKQSEIPPRLASLTLNYDHYNAATPIEDVSYIYGLKLNTLHDEAFLGTLFNSDGSPGAKLKDYVKELTDLVPIMWGSFKWDEAYWDVVGKNLMGLHVLPNIWDPRLGEVTNELFQTGIGDRSDLKVRVGEDWFPEVHSGYYYLTVKETLTVQAEGDAFVVYTTDPNPQFVTLSLPAQIVSVEQNKIKFKADDLDAGTNVEVAYRAKHYLFADKKAEEYQSTDTITLEGAPVPNTPVIVEADGKILKEVAFIPENPLDTLPSIANYEKVVGNSREEFCLNYGPAFAVEIDGVPVDQILVEHNKVKVMIPAGETRTVSYKIKDTFVFYYDAEDKPRILLSDIYDNIKVIYEGGATTSFYKATEIDLNPLHSHITSGFVYLTNEVSELKSFSVRASPDVVRGDGLMTSLIVVDALDSLERPVLNIGPDYEKKIDVNIELATDDGEPVSSPGIVIHRGTFYNRNIYAYKPPSAEELPDRTDGTGRKKPCTARITFTCGSITEEVNIKVR